MRLRMEAFNSSLGRTAYAVSSMILASAKKMFMSQFYDF